MNEQLEFLEKLLTSVKQAETLTKVAQELYVSQPYVSRILKQAEEKYQVQLVERQKNPISLTLAGQTLLNGLQKMRQTSQELTQQLEILSKTQAGHLTLAINQPFSAIDLPDILQKVQYRYPDLNLEVIEETTNRVANQLANGQVNLFIGRIINDPTLEVLYLRNDQLCLVVPENASLYQPNKRLRTLTYTQLQALSDQNFIRLSGTSSFQNMIDHLFSDHGIQIKHCLSLPNSIATTLAAAKGLGMTVSSLPVVNYCLTPQNPVNILLFPKEMLNLNLGISYAKNADPFVAEIALFLQTIFQTQHEGKIFK